MFIFYDTETTGLNADFDQILQIALVFTDENLNVLASKKMECRRSPWTVPSPGAMLITGFTPDDLKNAKTSHFEMMKEIVNWTSNQHWPVTFVGYNSLGFDEAILSHNLEQTLHDAQLTTASNPHNNKSNGRFDIFLAVKAALAYMPGVLTLDAKNDFGAASLSLSSVAMQNGVALSSEDAHDAMNDVRATVDVAKVIRKAAPALWDQMLQMSTRKGVDEFIAANRIFTQAFVGGGKVNAAVVTELGDGVLFDLSQDPAPVMALTAEQLANVLSQKYARPFRKIDKGGQPILMPLDQSDAVIPAGFNDALAQKRADVLHADAGFMRRLAEAQAIMASRAVAQPSGLEAEQYVTGDLDPVTRQKLEQWKKEFLSAPTWQDAARCVEKFYDLLGQDEGSKPALRRFVNFAGRQVYEHAPQCLSDDKQQKMKEYIAHRVLGVPGAAWTTVASARAELEKIERERAAGASKWQHVQDKDIRALKLYYTALEKECAVHAPQKPAAPANGNTPPPSGKNDRKFGS